MDAVVCPSVKAVIPPLYAIVRSNGQHVDGQQEGGHNVLVTQVSATYLTSLQRVSVVALLLRSWNMDGISAFGRKGRAISCVLFCV